MGSSSADAVRECKGEAVAKSVKKCLVMRRKRLVRVKTPKKQKRVRQNKRSLTGHRQNVSAEQWERVNRESEEYNRGRKDEGGRVTYLSASLEALTVFLSLLLYLTQTLLLTVSHGFSLGISTVVYAFVYFLLLPPVCSISVVQYVVRSLWKRRPPDLWFQFLRVWSIAENASKPNEATIVTCLTAVCCISFGVQLGLRVYYNLHFLLGGIYQIIIEMMQKFRSNNDCSSIFNKDRKNRTKRFEHNQIVGGVKIISSNCRNKDEKPAAKSFSKKKRFKYKISSTKIKKTTEYIKNRTCDIFMADAEKKRASPAEKKLFGVRKAIRALVDTGFSGFLMMSRGNFEILKQKLKDAGVAVREEKAHVTARETSASCVIRTKARVPISFAGRDYVAPCLVNDRPSTPTLVGSKLIRLIKLQMNNKPKHFELSSTDRSYMKRFKDGETLFVDLWGPILGSKKVQQRIQMKEKKTHVFATQEWIEGDTDRNELRMPGGTIGRPDGIWFHPWKLGRFTTEKKNAAGRLQKKKGYTIAIEGEPVQPSAEQIFSNDVSQVQKSLRQLQQERRRRVIAEIGEELHKRMGYCSAGNLAAGIEQHVPRKFRREIPMVVRRTTFNSVAADRFKRRGTPSRVHSLCGKSLDSFGSVDTARLSPGDHTTAFIVSQNIHSRFSLVHIPMSDDGKCKSEVSADDTTDFLTSMASNDVMTKSAHSDNGSEHRNLKVCKWASDHRVRWHHTASAAPQSNGIVERRVLTLKALVENGWRTIEGQMAQREMKAKAAAGTAGVSGSSGGSSGSNNTGGRNKKENFATGVGKEEEFVVPPTHPLIQFANQAANEHAMGVSHGFTPRQVHHGMSGSTLGAWAEGSRVGGLPEQEHEISVGDNPCESHMRARLLFRSALESLALDEGCQSKLRKLEETLAGTRGTTTSPPHGAPAEFRDKSGAMVRGTVAALTGSRKGEPDVCLSQHIGRRSHSAAKLSNLRLVCDGSHHDLPESLLTIGPNKSEAEMLDALGALAAEKTKDRLKSPHIEERRMVCHPQGEKWGDTFSSIAAVQVMNDNDHVQCCQCQKWRVMEGGFSSGMSKWPGQTFDCKMFDDASCDEEDDASAGRTRKRELTAAAIESSNLQWGNWINGKPDEHQGDSTAGEPQPILSRGNRERLLSGGNAAGVGAGAARNRRRMNLRSRLAEMCGEWKIGHPGGWSHESTVDASEQNQTFICGGVRAASFGDRAGSSEQLVEVMQQFQVEDLKFASIYTKKTDFTDWQPFLEDGQIGERWGGWPLPRCSCHCVIFHHDDIQLKDEGVKPRTTMSVGDRVVIGQHGKKIITAPVSGSKQSDEDDTDLSSDGDDNQAKLRTRVKKPKKDKVPRGRVVAPTRVSRSGFKSSDIIRYANQFNERTDRRVTVWVTGHDLFKSIPKITDTVTIFVDESHGLWMRRDRGAAVMKWTKDGGPEESSIRRRITLDARSGRLVEDIRAIGVNDPTQRLSLTASTDNYQGAETRVFWTSEDQGEKGKAFFFNPNLQRLALSRAYLRQIKDEEVKVDEQPRRFAKLLGMVQTNRCVKGIWVSSGEETVQRRGGDWRERVVVINRSGAERSVVGAPKQKGDVQVNYIFNEKYEETCHYNSDKRITSDDIKSQIRNTTDPAILKKFASFNTKDIPLPDNMLTALARNKKLPAVPYKQMVNLGLETCALAGLRAEFLTVFTAEKDAEPVCRVISNREKLKRFRELGVSQKAIGSQLLFDIKIASEDANKQHFSCVCKTRLVPVGWQQPKPESGEGSSTLNNEASATLRHHQFNSLLAHSSFLIEPPLSVMDTKRAFGQSSVIPPELRCCLRAPFGLDKNSSWNSVISDLFKEGDQFETVRPMCGPRTAGNRWCETLESFLRSMGHTSADASPAVFTLKRSGLKKLAVAEASLDKNPNIDLKKREHAESKVRQEEENRVKTKRRHEGVKNVMSECTDLGRAEQAVPAEERNVFNCYPGSRVVAPEDCAVSTISTHVDDLLVITEGSDLRVRVCRLLRHRFQIGTEDVLSDEGTATHCGENVVKTAGGLRVDMLNKCEASEECEWAEGDWQGEVVTDSGLRRWRAFKGLFQFIGQVRADISQLLSLTNVGGVTDLKKHHMILMDPVRQRLAQRPDPGTFFPTCRKESHHSGVAAHVVVNSDASVHASAPTTRAAVDPSIGESGSAGATTGTTPDHSFSGKSTNKLLASVAHDIHQIFMPLDVFHCRIRDTRNSSCHAESRTIAVAPERAEVLKPELCDSGTSVSSVTVSTDSESAISRLGSGRVGVSLNDSLCCHAPRALKTHLDSNRCSPASVNDNFNNSDCLTEHEPAPPEKMCRFQKHMRDSMPITPSAARTGRFLSKSFKQDRKRAT